jgi:hypothetical protein
MKFVISLLLVAFAATAALGQSAPTLRIVTEDPNLPSDLYYGDIKVKPLRLRPGTNQKITIDDNDFMVQQHYIDFLNRMPEPGGFQGWVNILKSCPAGDISCDRIEVSSAFFRSAEFQQRGYGVYRLYSAAFNRVPKIVEFMPDLRRVSGFQTDAQLKASKEALVNDFMARAEFKKKYGALTTPTAFVDALLKTVRMPAHPGRAAWINGLTDGSMTRARVFRELSESGEVYNKYYTEAFVVMQYFGYLRRDPDILYKEWIKIMNANGGDYRVMINGFLNSAEYRNRF